MYKYIMARLTVNLTLLGVLATLPLSQGQAQRKARRERSWLSWFSSKEEEVKTPPPPPTAESIVMVHDHFRYATWVGRPWPLNVEPLLWSGKDPLETCNEWECYYGTTGYVTRRN